MRTQKETEIRLFVLQEQEHLYCWHRTCHSRRIIFVLEMCLFPQENLPILDQGFEKCVNTVTNWAYSVPFQPLSVSEEQVPAWQHAWEGVGVRHQGFGCRICIRWRKARVGELSSTVCHLYGLSSSHFWSMVVEHLPESGGQVLDWFSAEAVGRRETYDKILSRLWWNQDLLEMHNKLGRSWIRRVWEGVWELVGTGSQQLWRNRWVWKQEREQWRRMWRIELKTKTGNHWKRVKGTGKKGGPEQTKKKERDKW